MLALTMTLAGMAAIESLNVLNLGVTSAIVYESRLQRRSPLPGGLSFITGLFAATVAVGITVVLGVAFVAESTAIEITPTIRYRGELAIGVLLVGLACLPRRPRNGTARANFASLRRNPWVLAGTGLALGFGQAATDVMYLAALAMLSAHHPRVSIWPAIVIVYCAIELSPPLLVLFLASRRTPRAQRMQRGLLRIITRYAPIVVRALCVVSGVALVVHALLHGRDLR